MFNSAMIHDLQSQAQKNEKNSFLFTFTSNSNPNQRRTVAFNLSNPLGLAYFGFRNKPLGICCNTPLPIFIVGGRYYCGVFFT